MKLSPPTTPFEGVAIPAVSAEDAWSEDGPPGRRRRSWLSRFLRHPYTWLVLLPTLLATVYFYGFASPQYLSESRFVVRSRSGGSSDSNVGSVLSQMAGGASAAAPSEALAVYDYLGSVDLVAEANRRINLVDIYSRPESDIIARVWWTDPERLARYFGWMSEIAVDSTSGILTLKVRTFRPEDSKLVNETLLGMAEALVNRMSERQREDALAVFRREVEIAEQRVLASRAALTAFREREQELDSAGTAQIAMQTIGTLESNLSAARAQLREQLRYMRPDNPQIQVTRNRIEALQRQIAEQRERWTRGDTTITQQLAAFERLMLERDFADRQLASATTSLEQARLDAQRQQAFVSRVVEPNLAVYALYPKCLLSIISIFLGLSVLYGIGWLLVVGMREHAA